MTVKIFAIDGTNMWAHLYEIEDLNDTGYLPTAGQFHDVHGQRYGLEAAGKPLEKVGLPNPGQLDARVGVVLDAIETSLDLRLARQQIPPNLRGERKASALAALNDIRSVKNLVSRFDEMRKHGFWHLAAVDEGTDGPIATRGGWLHNLFCH